MQSWNRRQQWVLPWHCLLCGARGEHGLDLCAACANELPRNTSCCARCALPLAVPAVLCGRCQRKPPLWDAAWSPFRYGWPLDRLETRFKFGRDLASGRALATLWLREACPLDKPQLLVPVPLHMQRLRERGYNQSLELAKSLAGAFAIPYHGNVLLRARRTDAQTALDAVARRRNVRGAFQLRGGGLKLPAHVALIDDVLTTGATLAECAHVFKRAGVARVDVWALARAPIPRG